MGWVWANWRVQKIGVILLEVITFCVSDSPMPPCEGHMSFCPDPPRKCEDEDIGRRLKLEMDLELLFFRESIYLSESSWQGVAHVSRSSWLRSKPSVGVDRCSHCCVDTQASASS